MSAEDVKRVPAHWPPRERDGVRCDVVSGRCACGAWHWLNELWVVRRLVVYGWKRARSQP